MVVALVRMVLSLTLSGPAQVESREVGIPTDRGPRLAARLTQPTAAGGPWPVLVIAPGKSFDMDEPVFERIATQAAGRGFLVLRFNYDTQPRQGRRSRRFSEEAEDLQTAITFLRAMPSVDRDRIFVLGKSMGAKIAADLASLQEPLAGLILLTPPIHFMDKPSAPRPLAEMIGKLTLPLLLIGADRDNICAVDELKKAAGTNPSGPEVLIVTGDHQLAASSAEETERTAERVAQAVAEWLSRQIASPDSDKTRQ